MANSVDPDETAHYEPSHLDLHRLQKYMSSSTGLKAVNSLGTRIYPLHILGILITFFILLHRK